MPEEKLPVKGLLMLATALAAGTATLIALLRFHEEYGREWLQQKLKEVVP